MFQEYPKWIPTEDGKGKVVFSREEEEETPKEEVKPNEVKPKRGRPRKAEQ